MAEEKKVIKVKDLVIQAENVHFEPIVREGRPVAPPRAHPLFGPRPMRPTSPVVPQETPNQPNDATEDADNEETATGEQVEDQNPQEIADEEQPQSPQRPPFSWI